MEEYNEQLKAREFYDKTRPCLCGHGLGCHDTGGGECQYTWEGKCSCEHYRGWAYDNWIREQ